MIQLIALLMGLCMSSSVYAATLNQDNSWTESAADLRAAIATKDAGISGLIRYRAAACSQPMSAARHEVCIAAYRVAIAGRNAEKAALEYELAAKKLALSERDREFLVQELYPKKTLMWVDGSVSNPLWYRIWREFPDPTYRVK